MAEELARGRMEAEAPVEISTWCFCSVWKYSTKPSLCDPGILANLVKSGGNVFQKKDESLRRKEKNRNTSSLSSFLQSEE